MNTNTSGHKKVWDILPHHHAEANTLYNETDEVTVPPLANFMDQPTFPAKVDPANVSCKFKWDYPIVNLMSGHSRTCCRVPKQVITDQDLETYGIDAIVSPKESDSNFSNTFFIIIF
jgi:hypothetical protein